MQHEETGEEGQGVQGVLGPTKMYYFHVWSQLAFLLFSENKKFEPKTLIMIRHQQAFIALLCGKQ